MTRERQNKRRDWARLSLEEKWARWRDPNPDYEARRREIETAKILEERELLIDELINEETQVGRMVRDYGWEYVASKPTPYNANVVKEFYASILPEAFEQTPQLHYRGSAFIFDPDHINDYYRVNKLYGSSPNGLPPLDVFNTPYNPVIAQELRQNGDQQWDANSHKIMRSELSPDLALLYTWIRFNVRPNQHVSDVDEESAKLLYCIKRGINVDLGKIIITQIAEVAWRLNTTSRSVIFPSLIHALLDEIYGMVRISEKRRTIPCNHVVNMETWRSQHSLCQQRAMGIHPIRQAPRRRRRREDEPTQEAPQDPPQGPVYTGRFDNEAGGSGGGTSYSYQTAPTERPEWISAFFHDLSLERNAEREMHAAHIRQIEELHAAHLLQVDTRLQRMEGRPSRNRRNTRSNRNEEE